jgi:hypothetical protein
MLYICSRFYIYSSGSNNSRTVDSTAYNCFEYEFCLCLCYHVALIFHVLFLSSFLFIFGNPGVRTSLYAQQLILGPTKYPASLINMLGIIGITSMHNKTRSKIQRKGWNSLPPLVNNLNCVFCSHVSLHARKKVVIFVLGFVTR